MELDWNDWVDGDLAQDNLELLERKAGENARLWDGLKESLKKAIGDKGLDPSGAAMRIAWDVLRRRNARKLNRISGLLKKGVRTRGAEDIANALDDLILGGYRLMSLWQDRDSPRSLDRRASFYINNHLLIAMRVAGLVPEVLELFGRRLQEEWAAISSDEEPVVIAHRGDGATFEKVRQVFPRRDFDIQYKHEDENSREAVSKALHAWAIGELSGVECDVWFSQDNVPIIVHSQHIGKLYLQQKKRTMTDSELERMKPTSREPWGGKIQVKNVTADAAIEHGFMTLDQWLDLIDTFVAQLINDGKPIPAMLRVEIEMKDERLSQYAQWRVVEQTVSRFLKSCSDPTRYEVALFNGSDAPVEGTMRVQGELKIGLSNVVYGGGKADKVYLNENNLREVRFGLHASGLLRKMQNGDFAGKILTLAPGVEAVPETQSIDGAWTVRQLKTTGQWINSYDALTVEQAIQSARLNQLLTLHGRLHGDPRQALRIQVLTDFGSWGARYIRSKHSFGIGGIRALKRHRTDPVRRLDLACVKDHYKLDDREMSFIEAELVKTRRSSERDKYLNFGRMLVEKLEKLN